MLQLLFSSAAFLLTPKWIKRHKNDLKAAFIDFVTILAGNDLLSHYKLLVC